MMYKKDILIKILVIRLYDSIKDQFFSTRHKKGSLTWNSITKAMDCLDEGFSIKMGERVWIFCMTLGFLRNRWLLRCLGWIFMMWGIQSKTFGRKMVGGWRSFNYTLLPDDVKQNILTLCPKFVPSMPDVWIWNWNT